MSSALLQIETEIKDRLESLPFFASLTVLVEPRKNIVAEITARIAKLRTLIAPKIVGADDNHPNVHGTYFDEIRLAVGIFQQPLLGASDPNAMEIAEEVHKGLKNWTPASLSNALNPAKPGIEPIADRTLNILTCNFTTKGGFIGALPAVTTPVITPGASIVMGCATGGAAIFYTLDGSNPQPRSGTLYTASFAAPLAGITIKARAFLAGYLNSQLATHTQT